MKERYSSASFSLSCASGKIFAYIYTQGRYDLFTHSPQNLRMRIAARGDDCEHDGWPSRLPIDQEETP